MALMRSERLGEQSLAGAANIPSRRGSRVIHGSAAVARGRACFSSPSMSSPFKNSGVGRQHSFRRSPPMKRIVQTLDRMTLRLVRPSRLEAMICKGARIERKEVQWAAASSSPASERELAPQRLALNSGSSAWVSRLKT